MYNILFDVIVVSWDDGLNLHKQINEQTNMHVNIKPSFFYEHHQNQIGCGYFRFKCRYRF